MASDDFWTSSKVDIRRTNLFLVEFEFHDKNGMNEDISGIPWWASSVELPAAQIPLERVYRSSTDPSAEQDYFSTEDNKLLEWKEVVITLVDPITRDDFNKANSKLSSLVEVFRNIGSAAIRGYEKPIASRTSRAFKTVRIHSLPPGDRAVGNIFERALQTEAPDSLAERLVENEKEILSQPLDTWELVRPTLTNIDFGSLTYGQDDPQEITLSFLYLYPKYYTYEDGAEKRILL